MRAARADVVGTVGQAAKAVLEMAHAVACRDRMWTVNEKTLIERTGLHALHVAFATVPWKPAALHAWVARLRADLEQAGA
jgi:hypothetical protein